MGLETPASDLIYTFPCDYDHLRFCFRLPGHTSLSWIYRVQIALDTARGLEYIHEHTKDHYVHRDIKSSNILLDGSFRAKVRCYEIIDSYFSCISYMSLQTDTEFVLVDFGFWSCETGGKVWCRGFCHQSGGYFWLFGTRVSTACWSLVGSALETNFWLYFRVLTIFFLFL